MLYGSPPDLFLKIITLPIIEGHLQDSIAEKSQKAQLQQKNMIDIYKSDLEGIGLGITTMNITDVGGHRLQGVEEDFLCIYLLKEQKEKRRTEVKIRELDSEYQNIEKETKVKIAQENQRGAVDSEQATCNAESEVAGIEGRSTTH